MVVMHLSVILVCVNERADAEVHRAPIAAVAFVGLLRWCPFSRRSKMGPDRQTEGTLLSRVDGAGLPSTSRGRVVSGHGSRNGRGFVAL